ncbi:MAG: DUF6600 domain-containing protein [Betaproteobacteria bacterium]
MDAMATMRRRAAGWWGIAAVTVWFAAGAGFVAAQAPQPDEDAPVRVGRLADVGGEVYLAPEDRASDWSPIGLNQPIASGDNLWVADGGRAEIDVGAAQLRLGGETNVHVARLDDRTVALFVAQGRAILRLRVLEPGDVARIDTPNTQIAITRPGLYRVDVSEDRQRTTLVVREGEATLPTPAGLQQVLPGQTAIAEGLDATLVDVRNGISTDGFDTWSASRDRRTERSRSASYVSRQMVGYADLDDYGRWETDASYGAVWYPTAVDAGWAPYRNGHWTWLDAYGWTWVDDAPWGYAPSHYGRWVHNGGRWGWCPGANVARPYWSPAMVGWVGGAGWGLSASYGAPVYGWVPLSWGEPYRPGWHGCSARCWSNYNRPYAVRNDDRTRNAPPAQYVNAHRPGGITAVGSATFTGQKPVASNLVPLNVNPANVPVLANAPSAARPGAGHIPLVKPGTGNTPSPASTVYATGLGGNAIPRPGSAIGSARPGMPSTVAPTPRPSGARVATPGTFVAPAVMAAPGAVKPGSAVSSSLPMPRDPRTVPASRGTPYPSSPYAQPGAAPSLAPSQGVTPPTRYAAPVQRESVQPYAAPQRGSPSPAYSAPVPRETVQPTVAPQRASPPQQTFSAPAPRYVPPATAGNAPSQGLPMPTPRIAPQPIPAPVVQAATPPPAVVERAAPAPQPQSAAGGARGINDGRGGNDGGGERGNKPSFGR